MVHLFKSKTLISVFLASVITSSYASSSLDDNYKNAVAAYNAGDYAKAGELFVLVGDELHKQDAKRAAEAYNNAAISIAQGKDYQSAIDIYEKILIDVKKLPKERADFFYQNLIKLLNLSGQYASQIKRINEYESAFKIKGEQKKELAYQLAVGDAYLSLELYKSAAEAYKLAIGSKSVAKQPDKRAMLLTTLGIAEGNLGNYDAAIKALAEALEIAKKLKQNNTIAESTSNLGIIYWEKNQYEKAFKLLSEALDLEKKDKLERQYGVDMNNYGLVLKSVGSYVKAMECFDISLETAKKVKNVKDEGIATVNKALLHRITGHYDLAKAEYSKAISLFKECDFTEGLAGAYLGVGVMEMLENEDYVTSIKNFNDALDIYIKLDMPHGETEARLQIAYLNKLMITPCQLTSGMLFVDEDEDAQKQEIATIREQASKALELSVKNGYQEMFWFAHQLLGFADMQESKWDEAFSHYETAINTITSLYQSAENIETLGEYMSEKEDLYSEAMKVCSQMFKKYKETKYQHLLFKYSDTLKNEIEKANSVLANLEFKDPNKRKLFEEINELAKRRARAHDAIPRLTDLAKDATEEDKNRHELAQRERNELENNFRVIDESYKSLLDKWAKLYPADKVIFDSSARVDVQAIQQTLKNDQIVLHYVTLGEKLIISTISADNVSLVEVDVGKNVLTNLVRDQFLVGYIENGIGRSAPKGVDIKQWSEELYVKGNSILSKLYQYLIKPVENEIKDKNRLYIVSDGYLAQVPFGALVKDVNNSVPEYLIENYDIAYVRPSFIDAFKRENISGKTKKILAIANAANRNFDMGPLAGTVKEVNEASTILDQKGLDVDVAFGEVLPKNIDQIRESELRSLFKSVKHDEPTEQWISDKLSENRYDILYFATHGMPMSDIYSSMKTVYKKLEKSKKTNTALGEKYQRMLQTYENVFSSNSALNGFLYLTNKDDVLKDSIKFGQDGFLTIKEILEFPDEFLSSTKYVILSACNTGVSFVPKAYKMGLDKSDSEFNTKETERDLRRIGWIPGVDQVSFVDSFMRRGINNVYGTLWFVDDESSAYIMKKFIGYLANAKEYPDAVSAFNAAQRSFVKEGKTGSFNGFSSKEFYTVPHPYYWAVGAMFGK